MRKLNAAPLALVALLSTSLLAGCLSGSDEGSSKLARGSDSARSAEGRVYTDHEYRYTLEAPKGWTLRPNAAPYLIHLLGHDFSGNLTVVTGPSRPPDSGQTLADHLTYHYRNGGPDGDSAQVGPAQLRDGVEVIGVEIWKTNRPESGGEYKQRTRILHFARDGVLITVELQATAREFEYPKDLAFIDSSLTFF